MRQARAATAPTIAVRLRSAEVVPEGGRPPGIAEIVSESTQICTDFCVLPRSASDRPHTLATAPAEAPRQLPVADLRAARVRPLRSRCYGQFQSISTSTAARGEARETYGQKWRSEGK